MGTAGASYRATTIRLEFEPTSFNNSLVDHTASKALGGIHMFFASATRFMEDLNLMASPHSGSPLGSSTVSSFTRAKDEDYYSVFFTIVGTSSRPELHPPPHWILSGNRYSGSKHCQHQAHQDLHRLLGSPHVIQAGVVNPTKQRLLAAGAKPS